MYTAESSRATPKDGTHFDRVRFLAPELNGLVGEQVQIWNADVAAPADLDAAAEAPSSWASSAGPDESETR